MKKFEIKLGTAAYTPKGIEWTDLATGRKEMLVTEGIWADWIVYQHPEGHWVSLRKVTAGERETILAKTQKPRAA